MKKILLYGLLFTGAIFLLYNCTSPLKITTWKNPEVNTQVSKVVVMPLFEKLDYLKPFEQSVVSYFNSKGLKSLGSLEFLNPEKKYEINDIKKKCDSLGADAILIFVYEGADKTESFVAPTAYYSGYYGGYGGYWAGGYWGGGYYGAVATTGGYWETSSIFNLTAKLYVKGSKDPLWIGQISVTDPRNIDQAAYMVGGTVLADWKSEKLVRLWVEK